jgi:phosphoglycerol transferase
VGDSIPGLYKAKLFISSPGVKVHHVESTEKFDLATYPDKKNWLLVVGKFTPAADYTAKTVEGRGYMLVKPRRPSTPGVQIVDFSQALRDEGTARDSGLSGPEAFGRWSDAKVVEVELANALPKKLSLELKLYAFGPNIGEQVTVAIGQQERHFVAPAGLDTLKMDFETDGTQKLIRITIPKPTSPKQTGVGADERTLGLAFHELRIRDNEHPGAARQ